MSTALSGTEAALPRAVSRPVGIARAAGLIALARGADGEADPTDALLLRVDGAGHRAGKTQPNHRRGN